jgi:putative oxidoreductase
MHMRRLLSTPNSYSLTFVRLALGCVMFAHGAQKMLGWFGGNGFQPTMRSFEAQGFPAFFSCLAIMAEFFGGIGLILGLLSRIAAFGILCNMLVAVVKVHAHNGFFMNWTAAPGGQGFEYHILAIGMAIAIMIGGAGALSVDRALTRPEAPTDWPRSRDRREVRPGTSAA